MNFLKKGLNVGGVPYEMNIFSPFSPYEATSAEINGLEKQLFVSLTHLANEKKAYQEQMQVIMLQQQELEIEQRERAAQSFAEAGGGVEAGVLLAAGAMLRGYARNKVREEMLQGMEEGLLLNKKEARNLERRLKGAEQEVLGFSKRAIFFMNADPETLSRDDRVTQKKFINRHTRQEAQRANTLNKLRPFTDALVSQFPAYDEITIQRAQSIAVQYDVTTPEGQKEGLKYINDNKDTYIKQRKTRQKDMRQINDLKEAKRIITQLSKMKSQVVLTDILPRRIMEVGALSDGLLGDMERAILERKWIGTLGEETVDLLTGLGKIGGKFAEGSLKEAVGGSQVSDKDVEMHFKLERLLREESWEDKEIYVDSVIDEKYDRVASHSPASAAYVEQVKAREKALMNPKELVKSDEEVEQESNEKFQEALSQKDEALKENVIRNIKLLPEPDQPSQLELMKEEITFIGPLGLQYPHKDQDEETEEEDAIIPLSDDDTPISFGPSGNAYVDGKAISKNELQELQNKAVDERNLQRWLSEKEVMERVRTTGKMTGADALRIFGEQKFVEGILFDPNNHDFVARLADDRYKYLGNNFLEDTKTGTTIEVGTNDFLDPMNMMRFGTELALFTGLAAIPIFGLLTSATTLGGLIFKTSVLYGGFKTSQAAAREATGGVKYDMADDTVLPTAMAAVGPMAMRGAALAAKGIGQLKPVKQAIEKAKEVTSEIVDGASDRVVKTLDSMPDSMKEVLGLEHMPAYLPINTPKTSKAMKAIVSDLEQQGMSPAEAKDAVVKAASNSMEASDSPRRALNKIFDKATATWGEDPRDQFLRIIMEDTRKALNNASFNKPLSNQDKAVLKTVWEQVDNPNIPQDKKTDILSYIRETVNKYADDLAVAQKENTTRLIHNPVKSAIGGGENNIYAKHELFLRNKDLKTEKISMDKDSTGAVKFLTVPLKDDLGTITLKGLVKQGEGLIPKEAKKGTAEMFTLLYKIFSPKSPTSFKDVLEADDLLKTFRVVLEEKSTTTPSQRQTFDRIQENVRKLFSHTTTGAKIKWIFEGTNQELSAVLNRKYTNKGSLAAALEMLDPSTGKMYAKMVKMQKLHSATKKRFQKAVLNPKQREEALNALHLGTPKSQLASTGKSTPEKATEALALAFSSGEKKMPGFTAANLKYMKLTRADSEYFPEGMLDHIKLKSIADPKFFSSIDNPKMWEALSPERGAEVYNSAKTIHNFLKAESKPYSVDLGATSSIGEKAKKSARAILDLVTTASLQISKNRSAFRGGITGGLQSAMPSFSFENHIIGGITNIAKLKGTTLPGAREYFNASPRVQKLLQNQTFYSPSSANMWNVMMYQALEAATEETKEETKE